MLEVDGIASRLMLMWPPSLVWDISGFRTLFSTCLMGI